MSGAEALGGRTANGDLTERLRIRIVYSWFGWLLTSPREVKFECLSRQA
jgi:hypothetical protein